MADNVDDLCPQMYGILDKVQKWACLHLDRKSKIN